MAQREPVPRIEAGLPMDGQECATRLAASTQITASNAMLRRRPAKLSSTGLGDFSQNFSVVIFKNRKCLFKQIKCSCSLGRSVAVTFQSCNDGALPRDYAAPCRYMPRGDKEVYPTCTQSTTFLPKSGNFQSRGAAQCRRGRDIEHRRVPCPFGSLGIV